MTWRMHAGWDDDQQQWEDFGHPLYTRAFGHANPVPVEVTETPDGEYWGWLSTGSERPDMIYRREVLFRVCFPYGAEAEQAAGRGRIVRLSVRPLDVPS